MFLSNTIKLAAAASAAMFALSGAAAAEDRTFSHTVTITGTSDYVFRGVSQTKEDPAAQIALDMSYGIAYAGIWASNIDYAGGGSAEIDFYAGIKPVLGPVTFDIGVLYYYYPGSKNAANLFGETNVEVDYVEGKLGASVTPVTNLAIGVTGYYSPDYSYELGGITTVEGTAGYTLPVIGKFTPTISGTYGAQFAEKNVFNAGADDEYAYWNVGLAMAVEKFTFDFRYHDTNLSDATCKGVELQCDERFVFSAKITLP